MPSTKLIVFAKAPLLGFSKTRLIPDLGEAEAQAIAEKLLKQTLCLLRELKHLSIELCVRPDLGHSYWQQCEGLASFDLSSQIEGDLGDVQYHTVARALNKDEQVIIIGTDCPGITADMIDQVIKKLVDYDACIIPANDGGYVLLALKYVSRDLFANISWSTDKVYEQIMSNMNKKAWNIYEFSSLADIDTVDDLRLFNEQEKNFIHKKTNIKKC